MGKPKFSKRDCRACGEPFIPTRKHHIFCSPKHRKQHWIKLRNQESLSTRITILESRLKKIEERLWPEDPKDSIGE